MSLSAFNVFIPTKILKINSDTDAPTQLHIDSETAICCRGSFLYMELILQSPKYGEKKVLIDDEDFEKISKYHWNISYVRGNWYVVSHVKGKQIKLHRLIMCESDPTVKIDHRNHNGLDNRKDNLRRATTMQNTRNVGPTKNNKTGYKGVYLYRSDNPDNRFCVRIRANGAKIFGGYFKTAIEGAEKYNELATKYHGEFAFLNEINNNELLKAKATSRKRLSRYSKSQEKLKSGFHGVTIAKGNRKRPYRVQFKINGKSTVIGYFESVIDAAMAYNQALIKYDGDLRKLNKIPE